MLCVLCVLRVVRVCMDSTVPWGSEPSLCFSLRPAEEERDALVPALPEDRHDSPRGSCCPRVATEAAGVLRAAAGADGSSEAVGRGLESRQVRAWTPWAHLPSHGSHLTSCPMSYP